MRKAISLLLTSAIVTASPGLGAFEAAAQTIKASTKAPSSVVGGVGGFQNPPAGSQVGLASQVMPLVGLSLPTVQAPAPVPSPGVPTGAAIETLPSSALPLSPGAPKVPAEIPALPFAPGISTLQEIPSPLLTQGEPPENNRTGAALSPSEPGESAPKFASPSGKPNRIGALFQGLKRFFTTPEDDDRLKPAASGVETPVANRLENPVSDVSSSASPAESGRAAAQWPALGSHVLFHHPEAVSPPEVSDPESPARASGKLRVFSDPQRNKAFWRYFAGYSVFLLGFRMYIVGLPYLMSSFTRNLLHESKDPRASDPEAVKALIRENRSLARIAHWAAQGLGYLSLPFFTRKAAEKGPTKWLMRSMLIRSAILALIPMTFFASGLFSLSTALWVLFGLIAAHSFFQGITVMMESGMTSRLLGDPSVTPGERMRANAILTFVGGVMAIIGPAIAGQIASVGPLFGKTGSGGAIIYGVYALCVGVAGLIYATIRLTATKAAETAQDSRAFGAPGESGSASPTDASPASTQSALKTIVTSIKEGTVMIFKNRFLRTMLILSLTVSLFSDPLVFNVLPEYVENIIKAHPGAVDGLLGIPVLGWLFKGLTNTPMGYFGLLVAFGSLGGVLATLLTLPLKKLFKRLGFKSEESLTIPFYLIAALEIPAFWAMIYLNSFWGVLLLYSLQSLATGFAAMLITGVNQKTLGSYSRDDMNKILASASFLSILAAIAATYFYGFVLTNIPIATALLIAAAATTVYGALRVASPWLFFTKEQRKR